MNELYDDPGYSHDLEEWKKARKASGGKNYKTNLRPISYLKTRLLAINVRNSLFFTIQKS